MSDVKGRSAGDDGKGTGKGSSKNLRSAGTDVPYGFDLSELRKGLNALPYADGNISNFYKSLGLDAPNRYYVSKALNTLGLLKDGSPTDLGKEFVKKPGQSKAILQDAILKYPPYSNIIKACAVDETMRASVKLQRITQQLAAEKGVTKGIARRAASSFAALITEAGLGTCSGENKARSIAWVKSAQEIANRSLGPAAIKARVESTPLSVVRDDQPTAASKDQGSNGREGEKNYTIVQHQQNIGHLAIRPGYLGVVADMTNWTESQIQTFWTGHNTALELMCQIAKEGGDRG
jgi:hypothetical protein